MLTLTNFLKKFEVGYICQDEIALARTSMEFNKQTFLKAKRNVIEAIWVWLCLHINILPICLHVYICICVFMCIQNMCVCMCIYMHVYVYVYTCTYVCVHICACIYTHIYAHTCTRTYRHTYINIDTDMHIHISMHTHINVYEYMAARTASCTKSPCSKLCRVMWWGLDITQVRKCMTGKLSFYGAAGASACFSLQRDYTQYPGM